MNINVTKLKPARMLFAAFLALFMCCAIGAAASEPPAENNTTGNKPGRQEDITEYVEVTNVELIVRCLKKGLAVGGLKQTDFQVLENGRKIPITSFEEFHRKIGENNAQTADPNPTANAETVTSPGKKRLFLLYFWVSDKKFDYREAMDYFFKDVYSPTDQALIIVKNEVFQVTGREDAPRAYQWLDQRFKNNVIDLGTENRITVRNIDILIEEYIREFQARNADLIRLQSIREQIQRQLRSTWQEFQYKHLVSNTRQLLALSAELKKLDMEKWGMVFYQEPVFPHFDFNRIRTRINNVPYPTELRNMMLFLAKFKREIMMPNFTFGHLKKIKRSFINGDATFHVMWLEPPKKLKIFSRYAELGNVYAGWMETFKGISKVTGGEVLRANALKKTLAKVVAREDIYYRITYAPTKMKKTKRNIKVKLNQKGIKVYHLDRVRLTPTNPQRAQKLSKLK